MKRINLKHEKTNACGETYYCGFEKHPEGKFIVGNEFYRPYWPRGLPKNNDMEIIESLCNKTTIVLSKFVHDMGKHPSQTRAIRFPDNRMIIAIKE